MKSVSLNLDIINPQEFFPLAEIYGIIWTHIENNEYLINVRIKFLVSILDLYFGGDNQMIGEFLEDNWETLRFYN